MAACFLSTAKSVLSLNLSSSTSSCSLSPSTSTYCYSHSHNAKRLLTRCMAMGRPAIDHIVLTKRSISVNLISGIVLSLASKTCLDADAAVLEADDDLELLEKVKKDRKKRLDRQTLIKSSGKETNYLQDAVYRLSKVGQAIDNNDLSAAASVLGATTDADWVQKANIALNKLSSSPEEQTEVDAFNSSLSSLISSVTQNDVESSKLAFVSSATAFEKWTTLTGLVGQLKGL